MKHTFQLVQYGTFLLVVFCLITVTNPTQAQWVSLGPGVFQTVQALAVSDTNLFAGTISSGVLRSTNNGASWNSTGLTATNVHALVVSGSDLLADALRSTDNGTSWTLDTIGLTAPIRALALPGYLYAGTQGGGVFVSSIGGGWTQDTSGLTNLNVFSLAISRTTIFAGTGGGGVFSRSTITHPGHWTPGTTGLTNLGVISLAVSPDSAGTIFAGTVGGGVFRSNDLGTSWSEVNNGLPPNAVVHSLAYSGTYLFAGADNTSVGGVFLSTNDGTSWTKVGTNFPNGGAMSLYVSGTYLFASAGGRGVWRIPLSEVVTSVDDPSTTMPAKYSLGQNFPNPFNPSTSISFSLPSNSFVSLIVFDIVGREVSVLASGELRAGVYSRQWNTTNIPSGVYFYRLQAGSFSETKKLILLR